MPRNPVNLEDPLLIRMMLQRLCAEGTELSLTFREKSGSFPLLVEDGQRLTLDMAHQAIREWGMQSGENVELQLKDRSIQYGAVVSHLAPGFIEKVETCLLSTPRILRRTDSFRLADFIPVQAPVCSFTNARNDLLDGTIRGLSEDGMEIVLRDAKQGIQNILRMGEESLLGVTLADGLKLEASATVAYFHEDAVGLRFQKLADTQLMSRYCDWMHEQQAIQAARDREEFVPGGLSRPVREGQVPQLPTVKVWVDRDPMLLLLTEKGEFAQRLSEALSRKFGLASLDYIKGPLLPQLMRLGAGEEGASPWGRARMVLVHNLLRLESPLELSRQIIEKERCPLPVLLLGTEEDQDKKRNRAVSVGAVDYVAVEPFRVLAVLKKIDESFRLFEGG